MNKKRSYKDITKEKLLYLLEEEQMQMKKVAKYFNCNKRTIYNNKKKWGIKSWNEYKIDLKEVRFLCEQKRWTDEEISNIYGCSRGAINLFRKRNGIENKGMKNKFKIVDDIVKIKINFKGKTLETIIDKDDFELVDSMDGTWYGDESHGNIYVKIGNKFSLGYKHETVKTTQILLHQLIMDFPDYDKGLMVDHINGDGLDNRRNNLRIVDSSVNAFNRKITSVNKSGILGVHYHKKMNKWVSQLSFQGERVHYKYFDDKEEAITARKEAEKEYWGDIKTQDRTAK